MAHEAEHRKQANHNAIWADGILKQHPHFYDWAITSAFYSAVHLAEACFFAVPEIVHTEIAKGDTEAHRFRAQEIRQRARLAYAFYRDLQNACWSVRYDTIFTIAKKYDRNAAQILVSSLSQLKIELEKAFGVSLTS